MCSSVIYPCALAYMHYIITLISIIYLLSYAYIYSDLQSYKSQPLQRVSLRQNVALADRMWSGNAERMNVGIVADNRDFKSTYNQDFDSSILKTTLNA